MIVQEHGVEVPSEQVDAHLGLRWVFGELKMPIWK